MATDIVRSPRSLEASRRVDRAITDYRLWAKLQAERAGPGWARGEQMEARRAGIRRSRGAVHDSCPRRGEPLADSLIDDAHLSII